MKKVFKSIFDLILNIISLVAVPVVFVLFIIVDIIAAFCILIGEFIEGITHE